MHLLYRIHRESAELGYSMARKLGNCLKPTKINQLYRMGFDLWIGSGEVTKKPQKTRLKPPSPPVFVDVESGVGD
jgi:hypothetical protein